MKSINDIDAIHIHAEKKILRDVCSRCTKPNNLWVQIFQPCNLLIVLLKERAVTHYFCKEKKKVFLLKVLPQPSSTFQCQTIILFQRFHVQNIKKFLQGSLFSFTKRKFWGAGGQDYLEI